MSSKEEKTKKAKDKKLAETKKVSEDQNIIIIFKYTKERYDEMLRKKEQFDRNTLYLLLVITVLTVLLAAFNGVGIIYDFSGLSIGDYLYIGRWIILILSIIILMASLKDTFIKKRVFRYLFKKLYKVDIYKDLDLKDKIEKVYKTKEKEYKRKLTREEKKRIAKRTIRENCCYREMDDTSDILKTYKRKYIGKTDKLYESLTKSMSSRIKEGNLINKVKEICFNLSLSLLAISILLILIGKI